MVLPHVCVPRVWLCNKRTTCNTPFITPRYGAVGNTELPARLRVGISDAVDGDMPVHAAVIRVPAASSPPAVILAVSQGVVLPFEVVFRRRLSHIRNEVCVVHPPLTYLYTASAIVGIRLVSRVVATLDHHPPHMV